MSLRLFYWFTEISYLCTLHGEGVAFCFSFFWMRGQLKIDKILVDTFLQKNIYSLEQRGAFGDF